MYRHRENRFSLYYLGRGSNGIREPAERLYTRGGGVHRYDDYGPSENVVGLLFRPPDNRSPVTVLAPPIYITRGRSAVQLEVPKEQTVRYINTIVIVRTESRVRNRPLFSKFVRAVRRTR